jgi:hypothetical protein
MEVCTYCGHAESQHEQDGPDQHGITDYFCYDCLPVSWDDRNSESIPSRMHKFNQNPSEDE